MQSYCVGCLQAYIIYMINKKCLIGSADVVLYFFWLRFLPYLQYCLWENPLGRLQLMLLLYLADHLRRMFFLVFASIRLYI
jgi:hypothetical protein